MKKLITFRESVTAKKPRTVNGGGECPFCEREQLNDILDERGNMIHLTNKFQVFKECHQTLIIETDECDSELSQYDRTHLHNLFEFVFEKWEEMKEDPSYQSVLVYKNHGPLSGGSIRHPHLQIIGFHHHDYMEGVRWEHFEGIPIKETEGAVFNLSTHPKSTKIELNVILKDRENGIHDFSEFIQTATQFILNDCNMDSYNLFFYEFDETVCAKVIPRRVESPLLLGYSIPAVSEKIEEIAEQIKEKFVS